MTENTAITLATLDIETLSVGVNAVVHEIGALKMSYTPGKDMTQIGEGPFTEFYAYLCYAEQALLKRDVSKKGTEFVLTTHGVDALLNILTSSTGRVAPLKALNLLKQFLENADEIWINHSRFDGGILHSLYQQLTGDSEAALYSYRKEYDLFTARKLLNIQDNTGTGTVAHTSLEDCRWNMKILRKIKEGKEYYKFYQQRG